MTSEICANCGNKATMKVSNYYVRGQDRNLYFCKNHGEEYNILHPINEQAKEFVPQKEDNHMSEGIKSSTDKECKTTSGTPKGENSGEQKDENLSGEQGSSIPTDKKGLIPFSAPLNFKTLNDNVGEKLIE